MHRDTVSNCILPSISGNSWPLTTKFSGIFVFALQRVIPERLIAGDRRCFATLFWAVDTAVTWSEQTACDMVSWRLPASQSLSTAETVSCLHRAVCGAYTTNTSTVHHSLPAAALSVVIIHINSAVNRCITNCQSPSTLVTQNIYTKFSWDVLGLVFCSTHDLPRQSLDTAFSIGRY